MGQTLFVTNETADADVANFFSSWEIYRAVVETDCMEHAEIFAVVHDILARRSEPYSLLDLGCGDSAVIGPAMQGTPLARYVGVDLAARALEFARQTFSETGADIDLRVGDLMEAIENGDESFDVILVSFALHHFSDDDKRRFLRAARTRLRAGGELLLIDVVRNPAETRDEYLDRFTQLVGSWPIDDDKRRRVLNHVLASDYPACIDEEPQWARDLGYDVEEFYRGGGDTQCAWRMT